MNPLHIVQVLLDLLANSDPVGMTVSIGQLINKVNREKARIVANVNAARSRDGAIRAEMRLEFEDLASIGMLLADTFHPRNIVDKVVAISSETIMDLVNCYLTMLFDPILINLARINTDLSSRQLESFKDIITTISAFESLLTFTLFCGTTHSYVRKLVWATGPTAHPDCLRLGHQIRNLNHLALSSVIWNPQEVKLSHGTNEILEEMMSKISGRGAIDMEPLKLMLTIMDDSIAPYEKAVILWKSYFNEIPSDDFTEPDALRWKSESLNPSVARFTATPVTMREATAKVFNTANLASQAWSRPYLRAFKFWLERYRHEDCFGELVSAGSDILGIEVIRYHSGTQRFFATGHKFQRISTGEVAPIANRQALNAVVDSYTEALVAADLGSSGLLTARSTGRSTGRLTGRSTVRAERVTRPSRTRIVAISSNVPTATISSANMSANRTTNRTGRRGRGWSYTLDEDIDLVRGYNSFVGSTSLWKDIETSPYLCFSRPESTRTNGSLKDRLRTMERSLNNIIVRDPLNPDFYVIPNHEEQCLRLVPATELLRPETIETVIPAPGRHRGPNRERQRERRTRTTVSTVATVTIANNRTVTRTFVVGAPETVEAENEEEEELDSELEAIRANLMNPSPVSLYSSFEESEFTESGESVESEAMESESMESVSAAPVELDEELPASTEQHEVQEQQDIQAVDRPVQPTLQEPPTTPATLTPQTDRQMVLEQQVRDTIREDMALQDENIMMELLRRIPVEFDDYRFTEFSRSIPRRWRITNAWRETYRKLVERGLIEVNDRQRIKRNF